jgi:CRISPR-associated protein Csd1
MILQALNRYYDILSQDPKSGIAPLGYSISKVSYGLNLSPNGDLLDLFPLFTQVQRGKKTIELPFRELLVPEQIKKTVGIYPNFLCDSCAYVLGISDKQDPTYASKRYQAFLDWNTELLSKAGSPAALAVIAFFNETDPSAVQWPALIEENKADILKGRNLVFMFQGDFVHEDAAIRKVWTDYKSIHQGQIGQCLVTGEIAPIARLHPSLKGIRDAQSSGASLVSFNERAYESYGHEKAQGLNSPVSSKAAFAYTTVLNHLLSSANKNKKIILGDTTVVYWAESSSTQYGAAFMGLFAPEYVEQEPAQEITARVNAEERANQIAQKIKRGLPLDAAEIMRGLDKNTQFFVLGLAPNASRVSVRFFHTDPFEKVVSRIMAHYQDLQITKEFEDQPTYIPIRYIVNETVSKKASKQKPSPLLAGALARAVLMDAPYPAALFYAVINRIRIDADDKDKGIYKINYIRAATIKAFLIRKYRNQPNHLFKEVLIMALNEHSKIPAYVLGRLFAVLEKVQQEAVGSINASIKDRYFTTACASPASVFPVLLRLSQHHISKAEFGRASDRRIQDILDLLDIEENPIPFHFSLDEQGIFVLGYYHQRANFYVKKTDRPQGTQSSKNQLIDKKEIE